MPPSINATFSKLGLKPPSKPKPIYTYIPIHSPFKKDDETGGYYMGEDNQIKSICIKDKCLRIEIESTLRPGRFLGNHYLAFTVPQRALIITVDRVKEGMRAARQQKKLLKAIQKARSKETKRKAHHAEDALALDDLNYQTSDQSSAPGPDTPQQQKKSQIKTFISRFVDGYVQAGAAEDNKEKLAVAISDWFGRQRASDSDSDEGNSAAGIQTPRPRDDVTSVIRKITMDEIKDR
jgi:hypothetical protein